MYDPDAKRFQAPDPIRGNIFNPQSLNLYTYVLNSPLNFIDPWGLTPVSTSSLNGAASSLNAMQQQTKAQKKAGTVAAAQAAISNTFPPDIWDEVANEIRHHNPGMCEREISNIINRTILMIAANYEAFRSAVQSAMFPSVPNPVFGPIGMMTGPSVGAAGMPVFSSVGMPPGMIGSVGAHAMYSAAWRGRAHNMVVDDVARRYGLLSNMRVNFPNGGGHGFVDLMSLTTGEVWDVKRYNLPVPNALAQIGRYTETGVRLHRGYIGRDPTHLTQPIPGGSAGTYIFGNVIIQPHRNLTYTVVYWDAGGGLIQYDYLVNATVQSVPAWLAATILAASGIVIFAGGAGGGDADCILNPLPRNMR